MRTEVRQAISALGLELDEPTLEDLARYGSLVLDESTVQNITAYRNPKDLAELGIADTLTLFQFFDPKPEASVCDIGSGAGFPAFPLAILRRDLHITLIESEARKARFLQRAAGVLGLAMHCLASRAEDLGRQELRESFDVVTIRAVTGLAASLELSLPMVRVGGSAVLYKGPAVVDEIDKGKRAARRLGAELVAHWLDLPDDRGKRVLIIARKLAPTPNSYPRSWAKIRQRPLA